MITIAGIDYEEKNFRLAVRALLAKAETALDIPLEKFQKEKTKGIVAIELDLLDLSEALKPVPPDLSAKHLITDLYIEYQRLWVKCYELTQRIFDIERANPEPETTDGNH